jgi:hypothetical protein
MLIVLSFALQLPAAPQYDGSTNLLPNQSPWNWGYLALNTLPPFFNYQATIAAGDGVTTLDTTLQMSDRAGFATHIPSPFTYTDPDVVPLNLSSGFELDFAVKLLSEDHSGSANRAGFSVIALSSDATPMGIELGFWTNEVWAQSDVFIKAESSGTFDTTSALVNYRLVMQSSGYTLFANNTQILTGGLRNYSVSGFPYNQPNFTFFGDDTSSADAKVQIASFNVVPEPATFVLGLEGSAMALTIFRFVAWRRRRATTGVQTSQR